MNEAVRRQDEIEPPATGQVAVPTNNGVRGVQRREVTFQRHRECGEADQSMMRTDEAGVRKTNKLQTHPHAGSDILESIGTN